MKCIVVHNGATISDLTLSSSMFLNDNSKEYLFSDSLQQQLLTSLMTSKTSLASRVSQLISFFLVPVFLGFLSICMKRHGSAGVSMVGILECELPIAVLGSY